jgi:DNA invertase Pin-like site-specific DNA recombinase
MPRLMDWSWSTSMRISGSQPSRATTWRRWGALGRFLEAAKTGKIPGGSFLIVESLDRLSRQQVRKSLTLFLSIIDAGVNIVTLTDNRVYAADQTETVDLITSLVVMSRAHEESQIKSQRVGAAWANKRAKAKTQPLTAICPAWLRLSRDRKHYEVIDDRAAIVKRIFAESASGIGNYAITTRLNKQKVPHFGKSNGWHLSYVAKILKNRAVTGEFQPHRFVNGKRQPDGDPIPGYFPEIVDESTFYRAQQGLAQRRNRGAGRKGTFVTNLFSGITMVCPYCRSPVKFENKGPPPKGGNFLVCDGARRGLGCKSTRWRYDHFEASFLAFVRELDLDQIALSDATNKHALLESDINALKGQQGIIQEQMEKTYELLQSAGAAVPFVAGKLQELEARRLEVEAKLREKEQERVELVADSSGFYDSRDQIKALVQQLQSRSGEEIYRVRSQFSSKLKSLVNAISIAPLGQAPHTQKAIDFLRGQPESQPIIDYLQQNLDHRRHFGIGFADGSVRVVLPSDDDPLQYERQVLATTYELFPGLKKRHPLKSFKFRLDDSPFRYIFLASQQPMED